MREDHASLDIEELAAEAELVTFHDVSHAHPPDTDVVTVRYQLGHDVTASPLDWIGIFRSDWRDLSRPLAFQWAPVTSADRRRPKLRMANFPASAFTAVESKRQSYQYVYVSKSGQSLGVSAHFKIKRSGTAWSLSVDRAAGDKDGKKACSAASTESATSPSMVIVSSDEEWELTAGTLREDNSCSSDLSDIVVLSTSPSKEAVVVACRNQFSPLERTSSSSSEGFVITGDGNAHNEEYGLEEMPEKSLEDVSMSSIKSISSTSNTTVKSKKKKKKGNLKNAEVAKTSEITTPPKISLAIRDGTPQQLDDNVCKQSSVSNISPRTTSPVANNPNKTPSPISKCSRRTPIQEPQELKELDQKVDQKKGRLIQAERKNRSKSDKKKMKKQKAKKSLIEVMYEDEGDTGCHSNDVPEFSSGFDLEHVFEDKQTNPKKKKSKKSKKSATTDYVDVTEILAGTAKSGTLVDGQATPTPVSILESSNATEKKCAVLHESQEASQLASQEMIMKKLNDKKKKVVSTHGEQLPQETEKSAQLPPPVPVKPVCHLDTTVELHSKKAQKEKKNISVKLAEQSSMERRGIPNSCGSENVNRKRKGQGGNILLPGEELKAIREQYVHKQRAVSKKRKRAHRKSCKTYNLASLFGDISGPEEISETSEDKTVEVCEPEVQLPISSATLQDTSSDGFPELTVPKRVRVTSDPAKSDTPLMNTTGSTEGSSSAGHTLEACEQGETTSPPLKIPEEEEDDKFPPFAQDLVQLMESLPPASPSLDGRCLVEWQRALVPVLAKGALPYFKAKYRTKRMLKRADLRRKKVQKVSLTSSALYRMAHRAGLDAPQLLQQRKLKQTESEDVSSTLPARASTSKGFTATPLPSSEQTSPAGQPATDCQLQTRWTQGAPERSYASALRGGTKPGYTVFSLPSNDAKATCAEANSHMTSMVSSPGTCNGVWDQLPFAIHTADTVVTESKKTDTLEESASTAEIFNGMAKQWKKKARKLQSKLQKDKENENRKRLLSKARDAKSLRVLALCGDDVSVKETESKEVAAVSGHARDVVVVALDFKASSEACTDVQRRVEDTTELSWPIPTFLDSLSNILSKAKRCPLVDLLKGDLDSSFDIAACGVDEGCSSSHPPVTTIKTEDRSRPVEKQSVDAGVCEEQVEILDHALAVTLEENRGLRDTVRTAPETCASTVSGEEERITTARSQGVWSRGSSLTCSKASDTRSVRKTGKRDIKQEAEIAALRSEVKDKARAMSSLENQVNTLKLALCEETKRVVKLQARIVKLKRRLKEARTGGTGQGEVIEVKSAGTGEGEVIEIHAEPIFSSAQQEDGWEEPPCKKRRLCCDVTPVQITKLSTGIEKTSNKADLLDDKIQELTKVTKSQNTEGEAEKGTEDRQASAQCALVEIPAPVYVQNPQTPCTRTFPGTTAVNIPVKDTERSSSSQAAKRTEKFNFISATKCDYLPSFSIDVENPKSSESVTDDRSDVDGFRCHCSLLDLSRQGRAARRGSPPHLPLPTPSAVKSSVCQPFTSRPLSSQRPSPPHLPLPTPDCPPLGAGPKVATPGRTSETTGDSAFPPRKPTQGNCTSFFIEEDTTTPWNSEQARSGRSGYHGQGCNHFFTPSTYQSSSCSPSTYVQREPKSSVDSIGIDTSLRFKPAQLDGNCVGPRYLHGLRDVGFPRTNPSHPFSPGRVGGVEDSAPRPVSRPCAFGSLQDLSHPTFGVCTTDLGRRPTQQIYPQCSQQSWHNPTVHVTGDTLSRQQYHATRHVLPHADNGVFQLDSLDACARCFPFGLKTSDRVIRRETGFDSTDAAPPSYHSVPHSNVPWTQKDWTLSGVCPNRHCGVQEYPGVPPLDASTLEDTICRDRRGIPAGSSENTNSQILVGPAHDPNPTCCCCGTTFTPTVNSRLIKDQIAYHQRVR
ncbi:uncharacterized protein LOC101854424 isoform X2 [Aplysia californica]|uniref:Uncharacterized protein LOC101854424 isoform X2 n=1 Tax=Aplysia californica TaxID=6500 RepID=A0ABM0JW14_APLCA|nr:uncharacterized protein LOC101854424 isoform X2 [Aplysia californica]